MRIVHLMASPFFGGPERQMLGLALHMPAAYQNVFLSFAERGLCQAFLDEVAKHGLEGRALKHNAPRYVRCISEVAKELRKLRADVLCCSGYKPDLVGWRAARRVGVPVVSVSHGWTAATWKVRLYEALDRRVLPWMDAVVCVSKAQADKVRRAKVPEAKIVTILNAVSAEAFTSPSREYRAKLEGLFATPPRWIVGAAGRLSPEKGVGVLVEAAAQVVRQLPDVGFVVFGDGPLRSEIEAAIAKHQLQGRFVLAGFQRDLNQWLPNLDLGVMSSYTEGLPVILLETFAAGVPMVATAVGGIPEVLADGVTGRLVPPGQPTQLAERIVELLRDEPTRHEMGRRAREKVGDAFSFARQSAQYEALFQRLTR
jgi:glycosyltransferase involved in cell wall biosynthesis